MKRKIAILLSSMMVVTAMPLSAQAANFSGTSVQNAEFAKAGDSIDPNASSYTSMKSVDDLRSRKSVLTLALKDDGTEAIGEKTVFTIKLENGTFNKEDEALYQYRNVVMTGKTETVEGTVIDYATAMQGNPTSLSEVWANMGTYANSQVEASTPLTDALQAGAYAGSSDAVSTFIAAATTSGTDKDNFETTNSSALGTLKTALVDELNASLKTTTSIPLAHIPYELEIVDSTTATVTVPNLNLTNSDAADDATALNTKQYQASDIVLEYYKTDSGKFVPLAEEDYANVGSSVTITAISATIGEPSANNTTATVTPTKNPVVAIPLGAVESTGNGAIKASIVADYNSKVVDGSATITKGEVTGSTSLVYDSNNVKSFEDYTTLSSVVIKENVRNTIKKSETNDAADITLRLNGGFKFKTTTGIEVYNDATNTKIDSGDLTITQINDSTIKISIKENVLTKNRSNPIGIRVDGLQVEAINDNQYGNVELSVYGDGVTTQTATVAKRATYAYTLKTAETPKEIVAGRHYANNVNSLTTQDNTTVKVNFSEAIQNTLVESRALDFSVPEGVKIVGVNLSDTKNFGDTLIESDFEIINNGTTLRLKRDAYTVNYGGSSTGLASFNLEFDLSVDPTFTGDIKLGVTGGGQSDVVETVIAKAVQPITVTANTTNANIGYQNYKTSDIVITETKPGMLIADEKVTISLDAPYGTSELGFSNATFEVSGGELEVKEKNFSVKDGVITLTVDKASYKNPSTITIKNVEVGSTRSVPFGAYGLQVAGSAVINNYAETVKDDQSFDVNLNDSITTAPTSSDKVYNLVNQDNNKAYTVDKYVNIVTETGTFDKVVNVTVGEKTIVIGDQVVDMDVAPYIQASSNSTMVPLRFVSLALGVDSDNVANADASNKIAWDQNTKTATIYYGAGLNQKIIQFQAGSNIMVVDGTSIAMDYGVKAEIVDSRMFVPFRALGQALGVTVDWDADTKTAIYNKQDTSVATTTASTTATSTESTTESTTATTSTTETTTVAESSSETTTQANA